jgi:hypothetical protein
LVLLIKDSRHHALQTSEELRLLLIELLRDCILQPHVQLSLSMRGKPVILEVYHAQAHKDADLDIAAEQKVFRVTATTTELAVVTSHEEAMPYFGLEQCQDDSCPPDSEAGSLSNRFAGNALNADVLMARVRQSFVGFEREARLMLGLACLGLGFIESVVDPAARSSLTDDNQPPTSVVAKPSWQQLPKGLLVFGPPGTGKSQLVRSVIKALECNQVVIDNKILLSQ